MSTLIKIANTYSAGAGEAIKVAAESRLKNETWFVAVRAYPVGGSVDIAVEVNIEDELGATRAVLQALVYMLVLGDV